MNNETLNYDDSFEANIFSYLNETYTGTILIATKNNKSCQITILKGAIIAVSMGRIKGYEVATKLSEYGIRRASFSQNMAFPHTKAAFIDSTEKFTNRLKSIADIVASNDDSNTSQDTVAA